MRIGIPKEIHANEHRVATTPKVADKLIKLGFKIAIESGAGLDANFTDDAYKAVGVEIIQDTRELWQTSDIIFKIRQPEFNKKMNQDEVDLLKPGTILVSFIYPSLNQELMQKLANKKVTVLAMDCVPRISRAQKLDALSSMSNISGYKAVIEASNHYGKFFTGQMTAAGKVPPAKVFIIGVGVAGLAAIAVAKGLGAIVRAMDTRPEVKEQVKSLGAEFVEVDYQEEGSGVGGYAKVMSEGYLKAQQETIAKQAKEVDIIITTALIPGKPAPRLVTAKMISSMKAGSVLVDLAAEMGGNIEGSVAGEVVTKNNITIIGYTDLPSRLARQSSALYGTNLRHLLEELSPKKDGTVNVNMEDEVIRGMTVIKDGVITWPAPAPKISTAPIEKKAENVLAKEKESEAQKKKSKVPHFVKDIIFLLAAASLIYAIGTFAPADFVKHFTIFVLACFIGYMVIWNVTPSLHTPLMSVTNAISSIISIGALIQVSAQTTLIMWLAAIAIVLTTINTAGGFWVTQRMLKMFRK